MKPVTLPGIEEYAARHSSPPPAFLRGIAATTEACCDMPQMLAGPVLARFLEMLVFALRPSLVLEIGTFTGYSALAMATALPPGGRIVTCEASPRHAELARRNIAASPYAGVVTVLEGPALGRLEHLDGPFDFVFVDADKQHNQAYVEAVLPKLSDGGLVAVDNTLWNGSVLDPAGPDADGHTPAVHAFNQAVAADGRLACVLLTVRDGVTLIRRAGAR